MPNNLTLVDFILGERPIVEVEKRRKRLFEALMPVLFPGNGELVGPELRKQLETVINQSFFKRDMQLIPDYFELPQWNKPGNYMVLAVGTSDTNEVIIGGGLIALGMRFDGIDFTLYDKIFMHPDYRGNETYKYMIARARARDMNMTLKLNPKAKHSMPAGLRTSEPKMDGKYLEVSQDRRVVPPYFVHLFGIKSYDGKDFFSKSFKDGLCEHIAGLPPTFLNVPKKVLYVQ